MFVEPHSSIPANASTELFIAAKSLIRAQIVLGYCYQLNQPFSASESSGGMPGVAKSRLMRY